MKVRLVEPGWEAFTGQFGIHDFENGVSVNDLPGHEIDRIAANIRIVDENGTSLGVADRAVHSRNEIAPVMKPLPRRSDVPVAEAQSAPEPKASKPESAEKLYTADELAAIADEKGIRGLREIGESWDVRGRAIGELMNGILKAQNRYCDSRGLPRVDVSSDVVVENVEDPIDDLLKD